MSNPIIETDLTEVLKKLDSRFDKLENKIDNEIRQELKGLGDRLNRIEVGQGRIEEKLIAQKKIVQELKTSQKNQIWALIIFAFTAVASLTGAFSKI